MEIQGSQGSIWVTLRHATRLAFVSLVGHECLRSAQAGKVGWYSRPTAARVKTQSLGECYVVLMQGSVSSKACLCKCVILDADAAKQMLLRKSES